MKRPLASAAVLAALVAASPFAPARAQDQEKPRCVEQLEIVKAEFDKAPAGPKKDIAETHYVRAEMAYQGLGREKWKRIQERKCLEHLERARAALKE